MVLERIINLMYNATILFTRCVWNSFKIILLKSYPYEKFEFIVCNNSITFLLKSRIAENYLTSVCISSLLKRVSFGIFRRMPKIWRICMYLAYLVFLFSPPLAETWPASRMFLTVFYRTASFSQLYAHVQYIQNKRRRASIMRVQHCWEARNSA